MVEERQAILDFNAKFPLEGYRRLAFMMIDANVVAVSPSTVYRVLSEAGRLSHWPRPRSKSLKGTGFVQPECAHQHWHVDMAYLNIGGTFYYLCALLDGFSRPIVHWEIRESMTEQDVECIVQRALARFPGVTPRIISDNGPQFIAKDFKSFVRIAGLTHVRTSPDYPQSNGKLERWNGTVKTESLRVTPPRDLEDARRIVGKLVEHYNATRLHSAIGHVAPNDKLAGREHAIWADRDRKLEAARDRRRQLRAAVRGTTSSAGTVGDRAA